VTNNWLGRYLAVGVIWGGSFLFIALGLQALTPVGVGFWRMFLGGVPLLIWALVKRIPWPREPATWAKLAFVSLCMNSIPSVLFSYAEQHVSSGFAGIINAMTPITTLLLILLIFREETPKPVVLLGLAVGLIGALLVLGVWNGFGANEPLAVGALILAVMFYGVGGPFARRYVTPLSIDVRLQVPLQVLLAAATLLPFYVSGPLFVAVPGWPAIAGMLALGVLGTGLAYIWYYNLMAAAGSAIANSVTYLSPVVAVIAGSLLLHESIQWNELLGGAVVIIGAAISQGRFNRLLPENVR
jgi:drug/metabolite transporter (DMT)-like permease